MKLLLILIFFIFGIHLISAVGVINCDIPNTNPACQPVTPAITSSIIPNGTSSNNTFYWQGYTPQTYNTTFIYGVCATNSTLSKNYVPYVNANANVNLGARTLLFGTGIQITSSQMTGATSIQGNNAGNLGIDTGLFGLDITGDAVDFADGQDVLWNGNVLVTDSGGGYPRIRTDLAGEVTFGASDQNKIYNDGVNLHINPRATGTDNVVIGSQDPTDTLSRVQIVDQATTGTGYRVEYYSSNTSTSSGWIILNTARGLQTSKRSVTKGDRIGSFAFGGYDGSAFYNSAAILSFVDGTNLTGVVPQSLVFQTGSTGSSNRFDRMNITSSGGIYMTNSNLTLQEDGQRVKIGTNLITSTKVYIIGDSGVESNRGGKNGLTVFGGSGYDCDPSIEFCFAGDGGNITLQGGNGGFAFGSDFTGWGGNGGNVFIDGGTSGNGFTFNGIAGDVILNNKITSSNTRIRSNTAGLYFGASDNAFIQYDGTRWMFNSRATGTGDYHFTGGGLFLDNNVGYTLVLNSSTANGISAQMGESSATYRFILGVTNISTGKIYYFNNTGVDTTLLTNRLPNSKVAIATSNALGGAGGETVRMIFDTNRGDVVNGNANITLNYVGNFNFNKSNALGINNLVVNGNLSVKRPYGMFVDNTTQVLALANTPYAVNFSITEDNWLININSNRQNITFQQTGDYLIELSAVFSTSTPNTHPEIWVQKNGANVPRSNTRTHLSNANAEQVVAVPFILDMNTTDSMRIMWAGDNNNILMQYTTNTSYSPETPSIIMTITKISEITP